MFGMMLVRYESPKFDWRDLENLAKRFPMEGASGMPNWVLGGGVAVTTLIQAEAVTGRSPLCPPMSGRDHKDLDVSVFSSKVVTGLPLEHPHEIYCAQNFGRPVRCAYHARNSYPSGFYFELLRGQYFGFPPPTLWDVVEVQHGGKHLWTLSPEYIIASRCFSHAPLRGGVDDRDVMDLQQRFLVNETTLAAIVRRSPMRFLTEETIMRLISDPMVEADILDAITPELERLHGPRVHEMPAAMRRSLLLFGRGDLDLTRLYGLRDKEKKIRSDGYATAIAFMRMTVGNFPRLTTLAREKCPERSDSLHLLPQLLHLTQRFEQECLRTGWRLRAIGSVLGREFLETNYMHVFLAKLHWAVASLERLPKGDMYSAKGVLDEFFTFMQQPQWQKRVIE